MCSVESFIHSRRHVAYNSLHRGTYSSHPFMFRIESGNKALSILWVPILELPRPP